ncbi:hypothetical protein Mapa_018575 [Marchantia paleacea]|nr:hypothetical protein Mapa_018553 [Marchantia paleacea]KAG6540120.1 hypothetical protein Mapa_018575 [Marchantia paleacea]
MLNSSASTNSRKHSVGAGGPWSQRELATPPAHPSNIRASVVRGQSRQSTHSIVQYNASDEQNLRGMLGAAVGNLPASEGQCHRRHKVSAVEK